jgi:hypothetical protein
MSSSGPKDGEWTPADGEPPPRRKRRANPSNNWLVYVIGGFAAVLLLGCLLIGGGVAIYFAVRGAASPESQLIGHWEIDPDYVKQVTRNDPAGPLAANLIGGFRFDFNPDHTFKMTMVLQLDGKWNVTSRNGNALNVTMVPRLFGMDADPAYVTIVMLDKDHFDFDAPPQKTMTGKGRYRRVGTGR